MGFRKRRIGAMVMGIVLGCSLLAGCGNSSDKESQNDTVADTGKNAETQNQETQGETTGSEEKITLSIYAQYADDDTKIPFDYAVEQLAIEYPNVELELDIESQDDGQKLQTYAATGNLPDIFRVELAQIETFKTSGNIMVLNDISDQIGFTDKVYDSCKNILYNEDGNIYAFPYAGNEVNIWFYNKALFEEYNLEVPKTFDDLLNVIAVFKENDIIPMTIFAQEKWITTSLFDAIATRYNAGGIYTLDKEENQITEEAYVNAANTMNKLVQAGLLPDGVTNMNYDQAAEMFYNGESAMFMCGQWEIESSYAALGDDADWMYYPAQDEETYEASKTVWSGGGAPSGFAVNPNSDNKELAAEVAAFISEKFCEAKLLYRSNPLIAVDVDVVPDEELTPMMQKLADVLPDTTSNTTFAWGLTNSIFKTGIEDQTQFLCTAQYTADEFITEMEKIMERMSEDE